MGGASVVETELAFLCKVPSNCQEALISPLAEFAVSASFEGPIAVFAKAIAACGNCCGRSRSTIAYVFWLRVRISWQRLTSNWALCTQMRGVRTRALSSLAPVFAAGPFLTESALQLPRRLHVASCQSWQFPPSLRGRPQH